VVVVHDQEVEEVIIPVASVLPHYRRRLNTTKCMDLRFIYPTSNICERFFSAAGKCYSEIRRSLSESNLEAQLFLKFNSSFWGSSTQAEVHDDD
jgi:hypothetical protein